MKKFISGIAVGMAAVLLFGLIGGLTYKLINKDDVKDPIIDPEDNFEQLAMSDVEYAPIFGAGFKTDYPISVLDRDDNMAVAPYSFENNDLFSGKRITKIDAPVRSVKAIDENQYFTLFVVDKECVAAGMKFTDYSYQEYQVKLPVNELGSSTTVNKWISVDLSDQCIYVGANETLAFMKSSDPVVCAYSSTGNNHFFYNMSTSATKQTTQSIYYGIYADKIVDLSEKNISVLGDSISTFSGYSNDAINTNSTIGNNAVFYPRTGLSVDKVNETWWKQTCDLTGANLLVNNSWSGSRVLNNNGAAYLSRSVQLHDDTGSNAGTNPDIIGVYIGINDYDANLTCGEFEGKNSILIEDGYITPTTFAQAYAIMIDKMVKAYTEADIYIFTLPQNNKNSNVQLLNDYNAAIRKIANTYHLAIVDLASVEGYSCSYYTDDGLHPNEKGMDLITDQFTRMLKAHYKTN